MIRSIDVATGKDLFALGDALGYGEQVYREKLVILSQGVRPTSEQLTRLIKAELPAGIHFEVLGVSARPPRRWLVRFASWLLRLAGIEVAR
jgi:hypothetical protein